MHRTKSGCSTNVREAAYWKSPPSPHTNRRKPLKSWKGRVDRVLMAGGRMWGAKVRDEDKTQDEAELPGELSKATWSWHPNPLCTPFLSGLPLSMSGTLLVDVD